MTELLHFHFSLSYTGEGNGNPLQCSCLENPRDRGAWWAAVYGVAQSWTRLKRLSSSSSSSKLRLKGTQVTGRGVGSPGGLASLRPTTLGPWPADTLVFRLPRTTRPGLDYGLRGCQGHVQETFQPWNKMSEQRQGPALSIQGWGRGTAGEPCLPLGKCRFTGREMRSRPRQACEEWQDSSPRAPAAPREYLACLQR